MAATPFKDISSHRKALELARRLVHDKLDGLYSLDNKDRADYLAGGNAERAEQIVQNYHDTQSILTSLINEELKSGQ